MPNCLYVKTNTALILVSAQRQFSTITKYHLDTKSRLYLRRNCLMLSFFAILYPMTAYNRPRITTTDAAQASRKKRRKNLAAWWKKAGHMIRGFTKAPDENPYFCLKTAWHVQQELLCEPQHCRICSITL